MYTQRTQRRLTQAPIIFPPPPLQDSPSSKGKDLTETSDLGSLSTSVWLWVLNIVFLQYLFSPSEVTLGFYKNHSYDLFKNSRMSL